MKAEVLTPSPPNGAVPMHLSRVRVGGASGTGRADMWRASARTPPACHRSSARPRTGSHVSCQPDGWRPEERAFRAELWPC